jgi:SAM-dependent methyltransferase
MTRKELTGRGPGDGADERGTGDVAADTDAVTNCDWLALDPGTDALQREGLAAWVERLTPACAAVRVLDLGAGDGRATRVFAEMGCDVTSVDHDPRACELLRQLARQIDTRDDESGHQPSRLRVVQGDMLTEADRLVSAGERFDVIACVGNTLLMLDDLIATLGLFRSTTRLLAPGGVFLIDDFAHELWADVADGLWQTGFSSDDPDDPELMQLVWAADDNVIALRQAAEVDPESHGITAGDRRLRLYSMGELRLLAHVAGLTPPNADARGHLIAFRRAE